MTALQRPWHWRLQEAKKKKKVESPRIGKAAFKHEPNSSPGEWNECSETDEQTQIVQSWAKARQASQLSSASKSCHFNCNNKKANKGPDYRPLWRLYLQVKCNIWKYKQALSCQRLVTDHPSNAINMQHVFLLCKREHVELLCTFSVRFSKCF